MTAITVTGKTFEHRDRLKELGGRWDATTKNWRFDYAKPDTIAQIKQLVGCMIVTQPETKPFDIEKFLDRYQDTPKDGKNKTIVYGDDARYLNAFKDRNPIAFFGFSNLSAITKFVDAIPHEKRMGSRDAGWSRDQATWYGSRDMAEALDLARNGWRKGVENAARVVDMINVDHALQKRRKHAIAGGSVNVGRLLTGNPAHMRKRPKLPGKRVITLFVENTASSSINVECLIIRAAICAAIADVLEQQGYSCEIVACTMQFWSTSPYAQTAVTVKQSGEKLNLEDVTFALGHPSFLRRFNFACVSQCDELQSIWRTQGQPKPAFASDAKEIYIRHLTNNVNGDNLEEIARKMLPMIIPHNLPIEIGE